MQTKETKEWSKFYQERYRARVRNNMPQIFWNKIFREKNLWLEFMVKLIPGKMYRVEQKMFAGDTSVQITRNNSDEDGGESYDCALIPIPSGSLLMYIGLHNYKLARSKRSKKVIEVHSFLYEEKVLLVHRFQIDGNIEKYLTMLA